MQGNYRVYCGVIYCVGISVWAQILRLVNVIDFVIQQSSSNDWKE